MSPIERTLWVSQWLSWLTVGAGLDPLPPKSGKDFTGQGDESRNSEIQMQSLVYGADAWGYMNLWTWAQACEYDWPQR